MQLRYKAEGMDDMEFQDSDKHIRNLMTEYQDKQDAIVEVADSDDRDCNFSMHYSYFLSQNV